MYVRHVYTGAVTEAYPHVDPKRYMHSKKENSCAKVKKSRGLFLSWITCIYLPGDVMGY